MTEEKKNSSTTKPPQNTKSQSKSRQQLIADVYVAFLVTSLFVVIIGAIWAIKDIFTQTAYQDFLGLTTASKILIVALTIIGLIFIILFLYVLYKRGRQSLYEKLFKKEPKEKDVEEYLPAKIIAGGSLICIFVVFIGLIIATFEYIIEGASAPDTSGIWAFLSDLSGGTRILLVGIMILVFILLILGFQYIWQNGYLYFLNRILKYNKKYDKKWDYEGNQKIIAQTIFGILVVNVILIMISLVWTILDALAFSWSENFTTYPFGIKFSFLGLLGTGLFLILVGAMMLYKWGLNLISRALFGVKEHEDIEKGNTMAQVLTIFMLVAILMIAISLIIWLSTLIARSISEDAADNIFMAFRDLSIGLQLFSYSSLIFGFFLLSLLFVYMLKNGYFIAFEMIEKTEEKIDEGLDKTEKALKKKKKKK